MCRVRLAMCLKKKNWPDDLAMTDIDVVAHVMVLYRLFLDFSIDKHQTNKYFYTTI